MHWRRVGDRGCALSWVLGKRKRLALVTAAGAGRAPCRVERSDDPCGCSAVWLPPPFWLRLRRGGCGVAVAQVRGCFVI